jgi:hypothetical protein
MWANRVFAARINLHHLEVYVKTVMLHHKVMELYRAFRAGRENTDDGSLTGLASGMTAEVIIILTQEVIQVYQFGSTAKHFTQMHLAVVHWLFTLVTTIMLEN